MRSRSQELQGTLWLGAGRTAVRQWALAGAATARWARACTTQGRRAPQPALPLAGPTLLHPVVRVQLSHMSRCAAPALAPVCSAGYCRPALGARAQLRGGVSAGGWRWGVPDGALPR